MFVLWVVVINIFLVFSGSPLQPAGPWTSQPDLLDRFFGPEPFTLDRRPRYPFRFRTEQPFEAASGYLMADAQAVLFRAKISRLGSNLDGREETLGVEEVAAEAKVIVNAMVEADGLLPFVSLQAAVRAGLALEWAIPIGPVSTDMRAVACAVSMHLIALEEVHYNFYRTRPIFHSVLGEPPPASDARRINHPEWPAIIFQGRESMRTEVIEEAKGAAGVGGIDAVFLMDLELTIRKSVGASHEPIVSAQNE